MDWQPIKTAPKYKDLLLGYQAEGKVHLVSKFGVGSFCAFGLVDWPWTMPPTHWIEIPELKPATPTQ